MLILCRSLTYAQRAARALSRAGYPAHVTRISPEATGTGCGYTVSVPDRDMPASVAYLREHGFPASRVFKRGGGGSLLEIVP